MSGRAPLRAVLARTVPVDVLATLEGADDDEAWELRKRLDASDPDVVVASLGRIDTDAAWRLREAWLARRGGEDGVGRFRGEQGVGPRG